MVILRPNQIESADAVEDAWRRGVRRPLVDSCVGSGKSLSMAELARRAWERRERTLIGAHTRELVEQNAKACRALGLDCGINAAALGERTWRAPVISVAIQSVYKNANAFGPIANFLGDEAHLWPHTEQGMYRGLVRDLGPVRIGGFSGTVFRLKGGSLVEGEAAPFDEVVYRYSIIDGIRDGYLVPAFSVEADDKIDPTKLKRAAGEYTGDSQDAQMLSLMDNHIAQMIHHGADRRAWLVFEASTKAAKAMAERMNQWGIPTGLVLGETPAAERAMTIMSYAAGRLRALVNVAALTTGFDDQRVDMLVMRRRTKSVGLYIQMTGRLLRTIAGNISASIAAGKADGIVLDFAGNIDEHGPLDFIRPKENSVKLVSCEACGKRNQPAAMRCWACDEPMTKLCPACLCSVRKGVQDCPHCDYDMRVERSEPQDPATKLLKTPSGAALIASYRNGTERDGGWQPLARVFIENDQPAAIVPGFGVVKFCGVFADNAQRIRWVRLAGNDVEAALMMNGASRTVALQLMPDGTQLPVPMPGSVAA